MNKISVIKEISDNKIVAILRKIPMNDFEEVADSLIKGGIKLLEITLDSSDALNQISLLTRKYDEDDLLIGAGTVLDSESAKSAISAGAQFLISPVLNYEMIKICNRYDKAAIPGAMTPTEILRAKEMGADIIKVFPAGNLGPGYIKNIKGPLSNINIMVTGGINLDNILDFINSGAESVGAGGSLVDNNLIKQRDFQGLSDRAKLFTNKIKTHK